MMLEVVRVKDEIKNRGDKPKKGQLFLVIGDCIGGNDPHFYGGTGVYKGDIVKFECVGVDFEGKRIDPSSYYVRDKTSYYVRDKKGNLWLWSSTSLLAINSDFLQELYGVIDENRFGS